ncbi:ugt-62, partial [Pristionchus pacificus]|uniref:glucuronosyltransferase n=1 Tax=Pristionchus pacificus TaxID=54126 RepID=A0A2A6C3E5_PRIPA
APVLYSHSGPQVDQTSATFVNATQFFTLSTSSFARSAVIHKGKLEIGTDQSRFRTVFHNISVSSMRILSFVLCASFFAVTVAVDESTASTGAKSAPSQTKPASAASLPVASSPEDVVKIVEEQTKEGKKRLKIAIFAPHMANSQVIWNKRVGEELMKAGHDVTIYMMQMYELRNPKVDIDPRIRVVSVNGSFGLDGEKMMQEQAEFAFNDMPFWDSRLRATMGRFIEMGPKSCALFVKNKKFIADVENGKYDIAFTHMYNSCPIGIIHKTKIPTWVWLISGALMDNVAELMGVPVPPSYCVPAMMDAGEKMTFFERVKAFTGHTIFKMTYDKETAAFRAEFGDDFPDISELAAKAPLVMVNSNELYDFARPTLAKIVNIGGVGIKSKDTKPLEPEFATRVEKAKAVAVMSFGSIAPMYLMPAHWKEAFFHAFAQFPDVQFFLRYEKPEEIVDILPPNAYASKWLPQTDLLLHPKTLGLISHGGYNSVQDVLHAGVPIMATGLFAEQPRNAHLVERLGMGINVHKTAISKETVLNGVRRLVEDKSLKENAQRIKAMIATKPVSAETLLVRWTEFLAQHKKLDNLVPYGTSLSFFVYHSLDVIVFLSAIILFIIALFFFIIRCSLRCCGFCKKCSIVDDKKKNQCSPFSNLNSPMVLPQANLSRLSIISFRLVTQHQRLLPSPLLLLQMRLLSFLLGAALVAAAAGNTASTETKSSAPPVKTASATPSTPVSSTPEDVVKIVTEQKTEEKQKLKIAIFAPYLSNSQVIWNKRVGEELIKAGHDVTIYTMYMFDIKFSKVDIDPRIKLVSVNGSTGVDGAQLMKDQAELSFNDLPFWDPRMRKTMGQFIEMMPKSCEMFIKNKEFLSHIEDSKYDIAFTHMYNTCPIGIIHKTKIPTWVWLLSGALMENVADLMGVPVPPSYSVPAMMDAGEQMTFFERVKSFVGHTLMKGLWRKMTSDKETAVFRAEFGDEFPDISELAAQAPLVMVNSNELYDFARPTLAKIVNIGGIGIKTKNAKPLKPEFATRVEKAKAVVVMSFGSIAPMYLMPELWKEAYFNAFAQFPDVQFFLRYENPEEITDILPSNAYAAKWLPQTDLLLHPKTLGLISHGGYNSVQDALNAGVPIMATGLFAEQARNAHLVERLGMGINVHKTTISKETVLNGLRKLVEDKSLKANAQRIKSMIATKPVSAETLLVRWTEFLAQHKQLDNLVPYGNSLSFFVYHSLDVIVFLSAIILTMLALFFFIIRCSLRFCGFCKKCSKVDDKKKNERYIKSIAFDMFNKMLALLKSKFADDSLLKKGSAVNNELRSYDDAASTNYSTTSSSFSSTSSLSTGTSLPTASTEWGSREHRLKLAFLFDTNGY